MRRFFFPVLLAAALLASTQARAQRTVTLDDFLNGERVSGVNLSHGGNYVLEHFTVTDGPKTLRHTLLKRLPGLDSLARFDSVRVEWMPVTEALLLHRGDSLVRIDPVTGGTTVLARNLPKRSRVTMAPTEDYLILSRTKAGPKEDPGVFRILEPDDRQPGWRDRTYLVKWDLATGDTLVLAKGRYSSYLEDISADGRKLLIASPRSRLEKRPTTVEDVIVMDPVTLKADTLLRDAPFLETMCFSPDGKQLLVRASPEAFDRVGEHIRPGQTSSMIFQVLYRLDIATGKVTPLTDRIPQSVHEFVWSQDDGQVYFMAEDRDYQALFSLNPKNGKVGRLPVKEEMVTGFDVASGRVAYVGEGVSNSMRAWLLDVKKERNTLLEDSSAKLLEGIVLGEVHDWNYTHSRGETIYGRYYLPPHFDSSKKYPMIVNYYGGCSPTGRNFESRYPHHLYAAQGYVVYVVQPSGATGFGQEFAARHVNTWGEGGAEDIIEGVEKFCAAHPFVDKDRIGCIGASFGGFMSQYLVTKTDLFAAAISHAGISDITSYWGEGYWGYSYCEVSTANNYPWNAQEMIIRQSPLFNADKVHTPILFLHGMADTNVPVGESIQMFTALKLLGRETAFVAVRDQDHHILDYAKRHRWQDTIFAWFAKYLQDDPSRWDALYPPVDL
ncbi:MAG: S9 family peptidase [Bacteroidales bacterium]|nr:S9 family peptidase [Bacteroidales bacterium]